MVLHFLMPEFIFLLSLQSITSILPSVLVLLPTSDSSQLDANRQYWLPLPCCTALERLLKSSCGLCSPWPPGRATMDTACCYWLLTKPSLELHHLYIYTTSGTGNLLHCKFYFWLFHLQDGLMVLKGSDQLQCRHLSVFLMINMNERKSPSFLTIVSVLSFAFYP